jgi:tetratricopeptide (TPR) repeat protein
MTPVQPSTAEPTLPASPRRRPRWVWRLAGLAVLLAVGAFVALWALREARVSRQAQAARQAVAERDYGKAQAALDHWLSARPASGEAHLLQAEVDLAMGRPQASLEHLVRAEALGEPKSSTARMMGILKARAGRHVEAEALLRGVLDRSDDSEPDAAEALARVYLETFQFPAARPVLDRWIRDAPRDPRPFLYRVEIARLEAEEPAVLIQDYRSALQRDPSLDTARLGLAEQLVKANRFEEAAEEFTTCLEREPENPGAMVGAGYNALLRGDDETAARWFDRALAIAPDDPVILRERAAVDVQRGEFTAALTRLDRAIALKPTDGESHHRRSLVLRRLGREDEAKSARETALRLRAEDARIVDLRKSLMRSPNDEGLRVELARWLLQRGQRDEAIRWANLVLRDHPGQPEISRLLGDLYQREGNLGLANFYRTAAGAATSPSSSP